VLIGRIVHLIADMSIPSHVHRVAHDRDPFEWWVEGNRARLAALPVPEVAVPARPSELIESLARAAAKHRPDRTNTPFGRFLKKRGWRRGVSAAEVSAQAVELVPLAAGYGAALLRMFARDVGLGR